MILQSSESARARVRKMKKYISRRKIHRQALFRAYVCVHADGLKDRSLSGRWRKKFRKEITRAQRGFKIKIHCARRHSEREREAEIVVSF